MITRPRVLPGCPAPAGPVFSETRAGSRGAAGPGAYAGGEPSMWIDVVIVTLLLATCALLKRADWHTRFLTRIRNSGSPWAQAAHDAIARVRPKRARPQAQPPSTG